MKPYQLVVFILALTLSINLMAQCDSLIQKPNIDIIGKMYSNPANCDGTPFLIDKWLPAEVKLSSGEKTLIERVKFDQLTNNLIFYNKDLKRVFTIENQTIESFTIIDNQIKYHFERYNGPTLKLKLRQGKFVQLFSEGKYTLGVYHLSSIEDPVATNTRRKIQPEKIYFIQNDDQISTQIHLRRRAIYDLFPKQKIEMRKLMNKLHIHNNSEESFTILFDHLNSYN